MHATGLSYALSQACLAVAGSKAVGMRRGMPALCPHLKPGYHRLVLWSFMLVVYRGQGRYATCEDATYAGSDLHT